MHTSIVRLKMPNKKYTPRCKLKVWLVKILETDPLAFEVV